jgi:YHS domain-containing protein
MRRGAFMLAAAVYLIGSAAFAADTASKGATQEKCPVMGYPINEQYHVDHEGKRIYFCCSACPQEFQKDPGKYLKKLNEGTGIPEKNSKTKQTVAQ